MDDNDFLRNEFMKLKSVVEFLCLYIQDNNKRLNTLTYPCNNGEQTKESFAYQWEHMNTGKGLLDDPSFNTVDAILQMTRLDREWFKGKTVVDVGCGTGRFSKGFCELGAQVISTDVAEDALNTVREVCSPYPKFKKALVFDLEIDKYSSNTVSDYIQRADLVWCFGVIHHTTNIKRSFKNIVEFMSVGAKLFLMVYGYPRIDNITDFVELINYMKMRMDTATMTFDKKVEYLQNLHIPEDRIHGYFDAISPSINMLCTVEEVFGWLNEYGFDNMTLTKDNRNIHVIAERKVNP